MNLLTGPRPLLRRSAAATAVLLCCGLLQAQRTEPLPDAPSTLFRAQTTPQQTQQPTPAQAASQGVEDAARGTQRASGPARISGTVMEMNGDISAGVQVVLTLLPPGSAPPVDGGSTSTDNDGRYHFNNVKPGRFRLTALAARRVPATFEGTLLAGSNFEAPAMRLELNVTESIDVTASREEVAEAELKQEEHQRLAGIMPNFFVTYDWNAAPLDIRQKFELSTHSFLDPVNFAIDAGIAGIEQASNDYSGFGPGPGGYGKRYAALTGNLLVGTYLGGAIFPSLFHQDPRYFYKGTGTPWSRIRYALSTAVVCRGDNGKWQPNYSGIAGDLSAGVISNFWYPAVNRDGATLSIENGLINIGYDGLGNVVQEFLWKHLTPHAPSYSPPPGSGVLPTP